jgi:hypothetical protein
MTLKPSSLGTTDKNYLGKSQFGDPLLNGALDDFRIYSRALSATEMNGLFTGTTGGGGGTTSDLLANYLFNETSGTSASDASGNGKTAILSGTTTWATGKNGNGLGLGGTNGYASLPSGIVSGLTNFTISSWVKVNALSDWTRIFDFGTGTNAYMFLTNNVPGAGLRFAITASGNGSEQRINAAALPTGVWKHVAVTWSGNTAILYVDGAEVARNSAMTLNPSSLGTTTLNYIGKSQWSDPYLNGTIDDFRIYNRALSATEVASLASN